MHSVKISSKNQNIFYELGYDDDYWQLFEAQVYTAWA